MQVKIDFFTLTASFATILGLFLAVLILTVKKKCAGAQKLPNILLASNLTPEEAENYLQKLTRYMEVQKPYLNPELTLQQLSDELQIPAPHLSQVINEKTGYNFYNYVNNYRIEAVKLALSDRFQKDTPILELAYRVGFNSKTTFNKVFKQFTGLTPQQFRLEFCSENTLHRLH